MDGKTHSTFDSSGDLSPSLLTFPGHMDPLDHLKEVLFATQTIMKEILHNTVLSPGTIKGKVHNSLDAQNASY